MLAIQYLWAHNGSLRNVVDSSYVVYLQPLIAHKVYLVCVYRTKYLVAMATVPMVLFMLLCTLSLCVIITEEIANK